MTDYYINPTHPNANDGNAGTDPAAPWENLSAMIPVTLNDTVTIAGGARFVEKWNPSFSAFGGTIDATTVGIVVKVDTTGAVWANQVGPATIVKPDADFDADTTVYISGNSLANAPGFNGITHLEVRDINFVSPDCYHGVWIEQDSGRERRIKFKNCKIITPNFVNAGFYGLLIQKNNTNNDLIVTLEDCSINGVWGWGHLSGTTGGDCILIAVNTTFRGQYDPVGWLTDGGIIYAVQCTFDGLNNEWMRTQLSGEDWNVKGCYFSGGMYCMPAQGSVTWDADATNLFTATRDLIISGGALPGNSGAEVFARIEPDYIAAEAVALSGSADNRTDFVGAKTGTALDPVDTDFEIAAIAWPDADIFTRSRITPIERDAGAIEGAACGPSVSGNFASITGTVLTGEGNPDVGATVEVSYISGGTTDATISTEKVTLTTDSAGVWLTSMLKGALYHVRIFDRAANKWKSRVVLVGSGDSQTFEDMANG